MTTSLNRTTGETTMPVAETDHDVARPICTLKASVPERDRHTWSLFEDWCTAQDESALPAAPGSLAHFLRAHPAAPATQYRRIAVIDAAHGRHALPRRDRSCCSRRSPHGAPARSHCPHRRHHRAPTRIRLAISTVRAQRRSDPHSCLGRSAVRADRSPTGMRCHPVERRDRCSSSQDTRRRSRHHLAGTRQSCCVPDDCLSTLVRGAGPPRALSEHPNARRVHRSGGRRRRSRRIRPASRTRQ